MAYIGNTVQNQGFAPAVDYFNGDGTTVTFTLSRPVASVAQLTAVIDNVIQNPSSAFTVSGSAITFTSAPLAGTNNIWVEYTSLVTTYAAISQDPSVIGDITASGGYLSTGDFGNTYVDGTIVDYVTGNTRITTGPVDGITLYNGGPTARNALLTLNTVGAIGVGSSPSYGSAGQVLTSSGSGAAPVWASIPYTVEYLVVAGGAGGGGINGTGNNGCGGGGAGGIVDSSAVVNPSVAYTVTVGAGAAGTSTTGSNGSNSVFNTSTAIGGGAGGSGASLGVAGGSGGGTGTFGGTTSPGGSGTSGQGYAGGDGNNSSPNYGGGGGGGAGGVGANASSTAGGNGGAGLNWKSLGTFYAGGGGGGTYDGGTPGTGGSSIGGAGKTNATSAGNAGTANTGGGGGGLGGGGSATAPNNGGNGGSGVVVLRYYGSQKGTGGTITSSGGYTYHTFTTSGTYTA